MINNSKQLLTAKSVLHIDETFTQIPKRSRWKASTIKRL